MSFFVRIFMSPYPHWTVTYLILTKILCINNESDILKQGCIPLQTLFFFLENFCPVCDNILVSSGMKIQKCGQKRTYFFMENKTRAEGDEKRIVRKSTLRFDVL